MGSPWPNWPEGSGSGAPRDIENFYGTGKQYCVSKYLQELKGKNIFIMIMKRYINQNVSDIYFHNT